MAADAIPPRLGARNQRLQQVRRLASSRRTRASAGRFLIEGPTLVAEALDTPIAILEAYHEPKADAGLVERLTAAGVDIFPVHPDVLGAVGDTVASQGILAVAATPVVAFGEVPSGAPVLVLVEVADPGNAGTLVRVAEACGFGAVLFTDGSVDPWSPKAVRASAGSMLRVPVLSGGAAQSVLEQVKASGRRCIGTRAAGAPPYTSAALPADVAIVLGSEAHGLAPGLDSRLDGWVSIPMAGRVESLNVAMAGTALGFELLRRSGASGDEQEPVGAEIVAIVSHELRSPLTSIKGYTSLLLNRWDRLTDEQKTMMLEQVNHDADRVTRLITELLDVSRLEVGGLVLRRGPLDIPALAAGVIERLAAVHPGLDCELRFSEGFPVVVDADADKVEQVLVNLVENAAKYGSPTGVRIEGEHDGVTVAVSVIDRGEGIPAADLPRIFHKFFRRDHGQPTGTGLGLWISRGLVEAHGGRLTAASPAGGGTTFRFTIPLTDPVSSGETAASDS